MENKIIVVIAAVFLAVLLNLSHVSAADYTWDNYKVYNPDTNTIQMWDKANIPFIGEDIQLLEAKLNTPRVFNVMRGSNQLVAEFDITGFTGDYDTLNKMISDWRFYDMKTGKQIDRIVTLKAKQIEYVDVPEYTIECAGSGRYTDGTEIQTCDSVETGNTNVRENVIWNDITPTETIDANYIQARFAPINKRKVICELSKDGKLLIGGKCHPAPIPPNPNPPIADNTITIGVFTDVLPEDSVDWQFYTGGSWTTEWGVWNDTFNQGLQLYYNFNDGTEAVSGAYNITQDASSLGTMNYTSSGLIGSAASFNGTGVVGGDGVDANISSDAPCLNNECGNATWNFWVYSHTIGNYFTMGRGADETHNEMQWQAAGGGTLRYNFYTGANEYSSTISAGTNRWYMITLVANDTDVDLYINGTLWQSGPGIRTTQATKSWTIGCANGHDYCYDGSIDEMSIYNRSLGANEILGLYNNGKGISYNYYPSSLNVNLINPEDYFNTSSTTLNFNATLQGIFSNVENASLYVWDILNNLYVLNENTSITSSINTTVNVTFTNSSFADDTYHWNIYACGSNGTATNCSWANTNRTFIVDTTKPFVHIIYPTNTTYATSALDFNYTTTDTHLDTCLFSKNNWVSSINISCQNLSQSVNLGSNTWSLRVNDTFGNYNITNVTFSISSFIGSGGFGLCNSTYNTTVLNISFIDETTLLPMEATMDASNWIYGAGNSFVYSNTTQNYNYLFCIYPNTVSSFLSTETLQYSNSLNGTYPQRRITFVNDTLSNSTVTNKTLYLLDLNHGVSSNYQVITIGNQVIQGAHITMQRVINGVNVTITDGYTDSAGTITFWLNPNYEHTLTVSKEGYITQVQSIRPSQGTYTITLGTSNTYFYYNNSVEGISWVKWPPSGIIRDGIYNFTFRVTSRNNNIYNCSFDIKYLNGSLLDTQSGCNVSYPAASTGGLISKMINVTGINQLKGQFYITIANGNTTSIVQLEGDARWYNIQVNSSNYGTSLIGALNQTLNMPEWGDNPQTTDFSRIVFFFIFMAIILATLNFFTGYDTAYPGAFIYVVGGVVLILSFFNGFAGPGWFYLNGATNGDFFCGQAGTCLAARILDNSIVAIHFIMLMAIYFFTTNKRYQTG